MASSLKPVASSRATSSKSSRSGRCRPGRAFPAPARPPGRDSGRPAEFLVEAGAILEPFGIVADEGVRGVEDPLAGAAVLDEGHNLRVGIGVAEGIEVRERRPAPGEDRLVVVTDDGEVAMRRDEPLDELELGVVRVLELVDLDVAVTIGDPLRRSRVVA